MTARSVYEAAVVAAGVAQNVTLAAAEGVRQTTIDAQNSVVGLKLQSGNSSYCTAVANANNALYATRVAAEISKQLALISARETLRSSQSDVGPL
jgi:hypothetical protein